jgi:hypothetical protein
VESIATLEGHCAMWTDKGFCTIPELVKGVTTVGAFKRFGTFGLAFDPSRDPNYRYIATTDG